MKVKREQYSFVESDEAGLRDLDTYPTGRQLKSHCNAYADRFDLLPSIRTSTEVKLLQRRPHGWRVHFQNGFTGIQEEDFDFVVLAVGNFSDKFIPDISGSDGFAGKILHSSELQDEKLLRGRRVVVVGFGKSALDCFALAAKEAEFASWQLCQAVQRVEKLFITTAQAFELSSMFSALPILNEVAKQIC